MEQWRGSAHSRGYTRRWSDASKRYLRSHPICVHCEAEVASGDPITILRAAVLVDHRVPHRGDVVLFWSEDNWQPLCKHHHDVKTATVDRRRLGPSTDVNEGA